MLIRTPLLAAVALVALGCWALIPGDASARGGSGAHAAAKPIAIHSHVTRPQIVRAKSHTKEHRGEAKGRKEGRASWHKVHPKAFRLQPRIVAALVPITKRLGTGVPPPNERRFVRNEVTIEIASTLSTEIIAALARRHRLERLEAFPHRLAGTMSIRWRIPDRRSVAAVIRELEADVDVISAQPNYVFSLAQESTTSGRATADPAEYALAKLRLPQAHELANGDKVRVAILDSGIDTRHPDLVGVFAGSFDALGSKGDVDLHGTAVAGVIGARGRLHGAAPGARLLAIRAFSGVGQGTTFSIVAGLNWAVAQGARVINMSFTGPPDPAVARNLAAAYDTGVVLVAAAGNKGPTSAPLFPGSDPHVIAVTAIDNNDAVPAFANRGPHIGLAAPGVDLLLLAPNGSLYVASGTSFAAPYVTGIIALMIQQRPELGAEAIRKALLATGRQLEPGNMSGQHGVSLVDAYQALLSLRPGDRARARLIPARNEP
jgi:Subtilase family